MIELEGLTKRFGNRLAVDHLDLRVEAGMICGLLGHNGAGKSTAIGMMLGQVWPTTGRVTVFGRDVTSERSEALKEVGAIFESPVFYDYLSGYRNLEILSHYTAPTSRQRILEVVEWVGLSGREHSLVRTYSHGMRARLALAQALLPQPRLLVLDEPGDGLDPEGIHEIRRTILRLHREMGMTILLSSHLLNEVEQLCTHLVVMRQGRKVFDGTLAEARARRKLVRLDTTDFDSAFALLREANLAIEKHPGGRLTLAPGAATEEVARLLVNHHLPVRELVREEMTLEDFYLELMKHAATAPQENRSSNPGLAPG